MVVYIILFSKKVIIYKSYSFIIWYAYETHVLMLIQCHLLKIHWSQSNRSIILVYIFTRQLFTDKLSVEPRFLLKSLKSNKDWNRYLTFILDNQFVYLFKLFS